MKRILKISYIFLLIALIFVSISSVSFNVYAETHNDTENELQTYTDYKSEIEEKSKSLDLFEIESLREENVKHFRLEDGTYRAVSFADPVHKLDDNNKWVDFDNTLYLNENSYNTSNGEIVFASTLNSTTSILNIKNSNYSLSFNIQSEQRINNVNAVVLNNSEYFSRLEEKTIEGLINENKNSLIKYEDIADNITIECNLSYSLINTRIIINDIQNIPIKFIFEAKDINVYNNNGNIEFYNKDNNVLIKRLCKPEFNVVNDDEMSDLSYILTNISKNIYSVEIEYIDNAFGSSNVYNRYIPDLDIEPIKDIYDTYISSTFPNTNYGRYTNLNVSNNGNDICLIKSDLPSIPSESTIISCKLNYQYNFNEISDNFIIVGAYEIMDSWDEYTVKWNDNISISSNRQSYNYLYPTSTSVRQSYLTITELAKSWYDGSKLNNGVAIKSIAGTESKVNIKSYEYGINFLVYDFNYSITDLIIDEGTYFIKNGELENFLQIDNDDSDNNYNSNNAMLEMWEFDGNNYQKWEFEYLHNGYYMIKSKCSGKVISVPQGNEDELITLVQKPYTGSYNQQWKITLSTHGMYILKARSSELYETNRVMCVGDNISSNNRRVKQREYDNNNYYKDEWILCRDEFRTINLYDSTFDQNNTLIDNITIANDFADMVFENFYDVNYIIDGLPLLFEDALADQCSHGPNEPCSITDCGSNCQQHHKNAYNISNQLNNLLEYNYQIIIMWSDRNVGTYCEYDGGNHEVLDAIALVYNKRSVIQFLRISGDSETELACMCLVLLHESAHTFGLNEVSYDSNHNVIDYFCVMQNFHPNRAYDYYTKILSGQATPFCESCSEILNEKIYERIIN